MIRFGSIVVLLGILWAPASSLPAQPRSLPALAVSSPDGRVRAELLTTDGTLRYQVTVDGNQVLAPSRIGLTADGADLSQGVTLASPQTRRVEDHYRLFGAHAEAAVHASEATVPVTSHGQSFFVDLHVANGGVAVRVRLTAHPGRRVEADRSTWHIPGDPVVWAARLDPAYESPYHQTTLRQLGEESIGLPLTLRVGNLYIALTEALVKDFGDLAVARGGSGELEGHLYADPGGWTTSDAVVQPWRVTVIARTLTDLVNTTLVQDLNPPASARLIHAPWIRPGRSAWQWLASGDPVESEQHAWIDWTSQLKFEYYLIDDGWKNWSDPWRSLTADVAYARQKHVGVWIWVHSRTLLDAASRREYLRRAAAAGVVGVKIDFPPPCNRSISNWYFDTAADAAAAHLMVDFHGANKPTGMERTWPNVLSREGVRGHEYQITRYHRVPEPDHDVILPFTRYVAGPGDYTPTVFTPSELMGNTWSHELAQAVLFTSPFLCFGGHPQSYLSNPARDVLTAIPPVWDETVVLPGSEPGRVVAEARRSGHQWFLAVINGGEASTLDLPLDFLGPGPWHSVQLRDATNRPDAFERAEGKSTRPDHIRLTLAPRGGFVGWLHQ